MDYKEKYEAALKAAKEGKSIEEIFPEVAENDDERIRKDIIHIVETYWGNQKNIREKYVSWLEKQANIPYFTFDDILALQCAMKATEKADNELYEQLKSLHDRLHDVYWLEKQGEQKLLNNDKYQTVPVKILDRLYESEKELERLRQSEQNPTDEVKPKFKVGDFVVRELDNTCYQIKNCVLNVTNNKYGYDLTSGGYISSQDANFYHLWTIKDAKDGDVLKEDSCMFIIEKMESEETAIVHCCLFDDDDDFDLTGSILSFDVDSTYPATKEQRDFLFSKMKEAGYEWDAEKKELRKIEQKHAEWSEEDEEYLQNIVDWIECLIDDEDCGDMSYEEHKNFYMKRINWLKSFKPKPKQEWSEEDEKLLNSAISLVYEVGDISLHNWLKSIKDRVQPQQKQEWSKEDSERLLRIHQFIWANRKGDTDEIYQQEQDADWLKSLKDRVQPQPKQEWSEEDEKMLKDTISCLSAYKSPDISKGLCYQKQIDWLKSLKPRWKPSEKEIRALSSLLNFDYSMEHGETYCTIDNLYNELKILHDYD